MTRSTAAKAGAIVVLASTASQIAMPSPAFGQTVADRTLSDVKVNNVGQCSTLTINFNIRVQVLSSFPEGSGRELHIRIRPLDDGAASALRESLRTPSSVPELRSIEYEGDTPSGPVLSLYFTEAVRFDVMPGAQPQSIVINLAKGGSGLNCPDVTGAAPVMPEAPATAQETPAVQPPAVVAPAGMFAVNVLSRPTAMGELTPAQKDAVAGSFAYETLFERDSQSWHRLRIGFFKTREEADAAKAGLLGQFPEAWVVKVTADERAAGAASPFDTTRTPASAITQSTAVASSVDTSETARLTEEAEKAIREKDNDRAIQLLTNAVARPANENTPRALELLGLTRERKGQAAHARAEYEQYLRRYPTGEASDRVRQRLAALDATGGASTPELRQALGSTTSAAAWTWGARGSFSQFYFRDQSATKLLDATNNGANNEVDKSVNLNQLLTTADITISGGNDRRQLQLRAAGSYNKNFGTSTTTIARGTSTFRSRPGAAIKALTALYLDYNDSDFNTSIRVGRQTRNSAGVLGRFDGALIGYQIRPKLRINLVGGFPVLTSRQVYVLKDRRFYGVAIDVGGKQSPLQTTLYWFDQHARGGFIDRRAVGIEARYLRPRFNAYTIIDYDVKYRKLNLGLLTLNYNFPDSSNISLTADYRQSPLLTSNNALIGQVNPTTFAPIADLPGLRPFFTDPEIYQLAKDRTLVAKSLTLSYSRPLTRKLQGNVDFTLTDTGGTPASGGVAALPATGKEYYYGAQLVGSGLFWENDVYILSGRYADTQRSRTYTADFNARVPITSKFRLSPRLRYGYRNDKLVDTTFRQFQPTLRMNYYPTRGSEIEVEFGGNFSQQNDNFGVVPTTTRESGFVLSAGYRIDF